VGGWENLIILDQIDGRAQGGRIAIFRLMQKKGKVGEKKKKTSFAGLHT